MNPFFQTLKKSFISFRHNWKSALLAMMVDVGLFFAAGSIFTRMLYDIMPYFDEFSTLADIQAGQATAEEAQQQLSAIMENQAQLMQHYQQIAHYALLFFLIFTALWAVFQGVSWFVASSAAGKKEGFKPYWLKFAALTALFAVLFALISSLSIRLSFYSSMAALPAVSVSASRILIYALFFLLFCLGCASYAMIPRHSIKELIYKPALRIYDDYGSLLPAFALAGALLVLEYLAFMKIMYFGGYAAAAFAVLILLPTISWTRFYAISLIQK